MPTKLFQEVITKTGSNIVLTPDWDNYSIHSSEIFVPIKYNIPVVLLQKNDTKITVSKNVKSFLRYEKAKTKVGDEDPGMITIGEDSLSDDGFCGTIIYSTIEGTLIYSAVFINGILQYILQPADSPIPDSRVFYADYSVNTAQILSPVIGDKDYEWFLGTLNGCVCVAYKPFTPININKYNETKEQVIQTWETSIANDMNVFTNGSRSGDVSITLTADEGGTVSGSGVYPIFVTQATITAIPNPNYRFLRWIGDFAGKPQSYTFTLLYDMSGTAVFEKIPCKDLAQFKANPLLNMNIKATISNNLANADWKGRSGKHDGIDLGDEGNPIYAMFDGVVKFVESGFENNLLYKYYQIQTPTTAAGNRVDYECFVNGEKIYIQCYHMQQNICVQKGDFITAGQIIGFVGRTGSASSALSAGPHLHLQIRKDNRDGDMIDPNKYLYSIYKDPQGNYVNNGNPINDC